MDVIKQLNNAIAYIENNLCGEIATNRIAEIALCPYDKFKRFFSYMTNMSVSEYIRKRRLTLAAYELLKGQEKRSSTLLLNTDIAAPILSQERLQNNTAYCLQKLAKKLN